MCPPALPGLGVDGSQGRAAAPGSRGGSCGLGAIKSPHPTGLVELERAELSRSEEPDCVPDRQTIPAPQLHYRATSQCHQHFCEPQSFPLKGRKQRRFPACAGVVGVGSVTDSLIKWEILNCGALGGPTFVRALPLSPHLLFDQPWVHAHVSPVASKAAT